MRQYLRFFHPEKLLGGFALLILATLPLSSSPAFAAVPSPLVSTEWLKGALGDDRLVIVDLRSGAEGAAAFEAAHIPGSIRSDYPGIWRTERNGIPWVLPAVSDLEASLSKLGIGNDATVVLVPAGTGATEFGVASWPYWVLKYLGHDDVAILDGGWRAWQADAGNRVASGPSEPRTAKFVANPRPEILVSTAEVAKELNTATVLVDARSRDQYLGKAQSPLVVRAGRIPGAINLSFASVYDADNGRMKSPEALAALVDPILPDRERKIIVYCNTGHWSSIVWFALHELLGFSNAALYEESMAGWTRDPSLPVETGPAGG